MSIESQFFAKYRPDLAKCKAYGFTKGEDGLYHYQAEFHEHAFRAELTLQADGSVSGTVIDIDCEEEYLPLRQAFPHGNFARGVLYSYEELLKEIAQACFIELRKKQVERPAAWVIPSNPSHFDLFAAFAQSPLIEWHQRAKIQVGDTVYIYMGLPYSSIVFRCIAEQVDLTNTTDYDKPTLTMILRMVQQYDTKAWPRPKLKELGLNNIRGARSIPLALHLALTEGPD